MAECGYPRGRKSMAYWLVEKKYNPIYSSEWEVIAWVYGENGDREASMIALMSPGENLIRVEAPNDEDARKQGRAYWNGNHQEPEEIDAWVRWAKGEKRS